MKNTLPQENILTIDIGASFIKATVLNQQGELLQDYKRIKTPDPAAPQKVLEVIRNTGRRLSGL